jgi:iron complex outermembrane receptor protein
MFGKRAGCGCLCAALMQLHAAIGFAQPQPASEKAVLLPEVVTSATRTARDAFDLPVSIDSVDRSVIQEDRPQVNISESLNRVPGIAVLNRQNYAQDLQISSRGFGARSTFGVRGIRLIADGIPATSPDGQAQAASFNLGAAERIEVMRGPFSSLYGNASGGVIQLFTVDGPPVPTLGASVVAGSYGTYKAATQFGGQWGNLNYSLDAARFHSDGYRDHSTVTRDMENVKLKLPLAAGTLTVVVNAFDQPETQDPLGLTRSQVIANPRQADAVATQFNTRKSIRQNQLGVIYDVSVGRGDLQARTYMGDRQVTQYLSIPLTLPAQLAATSAGGVVDLDRGYEGLGLRWTQRVIEGERPLTATVGADYDRQAEHRRGFLNVNGVVAGLKRDEDDTVHNTDAYAQVEWKFAPRWSTTAGLRHSRVYFNSKDYYIRAGNGNDSGAASFNKTTPAVGVVYNVAPPINVYANLGRGFETPSFAELAYRPGNVTGLNFALTPSTSLHREIGIKAKTGSVRANLALFRIDTNSEIVVNNAAGGRTDYKNASQSRRKGVELSVEAALGRGFEAYLGYTWLDAHFTLPFVTGAGAAATTVPVGSRIAGVPAYSLFGELIWRHAASGFHAGAELRMAGKIYVNDPNIAASDAYTIGSLRAGFEQRRAKWRIAEYVRVDNITDRQYVGSVIVADANSRYYEPSPGRNWLVGVNASLSF